MHQLEWLELQLESAIAKLVKLDLLMLDDLAYLPRGQAETSVVFELISMRAAFSDADYVGVATN